MALLAVIFLWRGRLVFRDPVVLTVGFTLLAIFFGGVLVVAVASPPGALAGRFFAHRFLRVLGRYSYAMYVFHLPLIFYMRFYFNVGSIPKLAGSQLPGQLLFTVVVSSASLVAASLSWHLYEAQFLKLKDLFPYDRKARQGAGRNTGSVRGRVLALLHRAGNLEKS